MLPVGAALSVPVADGEAAACVGVVVPVGDSAGADEVDVGDVGSDDGEDPVCDGEDDGSVAGDVVAGGLVGRDDVVVRAGAGAALVVVAWAAVGVPVPSCDAAGAACAELAEEAVGGVLPVVVACVRNGAAAAASPCVAAGRADVDVGVEEKTVPAVRVDAEAAADAVCAASSGLVAPASGPGPPGAPLVRPATGGAAAGWGAGAAPVSVTAITIPAATATSPPAAATCTGWRRRGPRWLATARWTTRVAPTGAASGTALAAGRSSP